MVIRQTNRGSCRECAHEALTQAYSEFPILVNQTLSREQINNIWKLRTARIKELEKEFEHRSLTKYALDAKTASGTKTEVICIYHLNEFRKQLNQLLDNSAIGQ